MKVSSFAYVLAWCLLLFACATQVAPSGGPEDKLPPRVAGVYPAPNSTNHPTELYVKLEFDEWINASIPRGAVSISPPIEKKLKFEVSGKTLEVHSRAELDTGTTYTMTFSGGVKDLRGNTLASPFQLVFSTGAVIDSLSLTGRVQMFDSLVSKKAFPSVGLYLMGESRESKRYLEKFRDTVTKVLDSLPMLTKEPPLYMTSTDSAGNFKLSGLKPGRYRVVAFVDRNGNQKLEPSTELAGIWLRDLVLADSTTDTLWIPLADMDTSYVELESVSQPFANILEAKFTRKVFFDSAFADTSNCWLSSPEGKRLYPRMTYLAASSGNPQFYFDPKPKDETLYKFTCASAKDSLLRMLDTARNELEIEWKEMAADTFPSKVSKALVLSKTKYVFPDDSVEVVFDKPKLDSMQETFYLVEGKDTAQVSVERVDPIRFLLKNEKPWATDTKIKVLVGKPDTTLAKADSNGVRDTVIEVKYSYLTQFETVPKLKLASLGGGIPVSFPGSRVRLKSTETGKFYVAECSPSGTFEINDLVEGSYIIDYYFVKRGSDVPDAGSLFPFRFGSSWRTSQDTLKIKNGENILNQLMPNLPVLR